LERPGESRAFLREVQVAPVRLKRVSFGRRYIVKTAEVYELATKGGASDFATVVGICEALGPYCLVGGLAVNCYVEPVFTLDADFVLVSDKLAELKAEVSRRGFATQEFPHPLNAQAKESELRIQFTTDRRYQSFPQRAARREVLGVQVRVAALDDLVQGKLWAFADPERRLTKRKKDELDLLRLAEKYPHLKERYPPELRLQLE
jgi:hypothetical protein